MIQTSGRTQLRKKRLARRGYQRTYTHIVKIAHKPCGTLIIITHYISMNEKLSLNSKNNQRRGGKTYTKSLRSIRPIAFLRLSKEKLSFLLNLSNIEG
jgi:hypothetical protein